MKIVTFDPVTQNVEEHSNVAWLYEATSSRSPGDELLEAARGALDLMVDERTTGELRHDRWRYVTRRLAKAIDAAERRS